MSIFTLGLFRDYVYKMALESQPVHDLLGMAVVKALATVLFLVGNVLVLSSMWALGFTGTYLGKQSKQR
jgi:methylene-fatty-acyl-phospholipid synthase